MNPTLDSAQRVRVAALMGITVAELSSLIDIEPASATERERKLAAAVIALALLLLDCDSRKATPATNPTPSGVSPQREARQ